MENMNQWTEAENMTVADLHTHTTFSDGESSVHAMAQAAFERGLATLGISDHSYTPFDPVYCQSMKDSAAYRREVRRVCEEFAGRMEVLCGIEQDFCCGYAEEGFDYVIGSVHYIEVAPALARAAQGHVSPDGLHGYVSVDETEEQFVAACRVCFGGDYYALARAYFENVARVLPQTGATIVGHFDIISKYNRGNRYFDEADERYERAWKDAADAIVAFAQQSEAPVLVEINHGGVFSGYRDVPYTAPAMQDYFRERGIGCIQTSDAHCCDAIASFQR